MSLKKKKATVLIVSIVMVTAITFLYGLCRAIEPLWLKAVVLVLLRLCIAAVALTAMKLTDIKLDLDIKNAKQYIIGITIALMLSLCIAFIPTIYKLPIAVQHQDFSWSNIIISFLKFILTVGPVEELFFRVYMQDTLISFFDKKKYCGVIIASLIFGLWHLINGSILQVFLTFGIGLVFGTCKYKMKDCKYLGLALGHGLYDFLNVVVSIFVA